MNARKMSKVLVSPISASVRAFDPAPIEAWIDSLATDVLPIPSLAANPLPIPDVLNRVIEPDEALSKPINDREFNLLTKPLDEQLPTHRQRRPLMPCPRCSVATDTGGLRRRCDPAHHIGEQVEVISANNQHFSGTYTVTVDGGLPKVSQCEKNGPADRTEQSRQARLP